MNTFENVLAHGDNTRRGRGESGGKVGAGTQTSGRSTGLKIADVAGMAFAVLSALVGAGLWYFGFHLLDMRAKNLGYINVTVALAVLAGAALMGLCVAVAVRCYRRIKAVKAEKK